MDTPTDRVIPTYPTIKTLGFAVYNGNVTVMKKDNPAKV